ncbi:ssDNA endonuclease and repair protein rad10 [Sorochytrium milnesiophthora]
MADPASTSSSPPVTATTTTTTRQPSSAHSIVVNGRQRGNPVLDLIRNVPWEYGDIVPDYVVGLTTCILFLSLKYHRLHPEYIYHRIQQLGSQFLLRVVLTLVDIDDHQPTVRELTKVTVVNGYTMVLAWSKEEAARYIETYKQFEHKPPDLIKSRVNDDYATRLSDVLTQVRRVNKTDVLTLSSNFGSLKKVVDASETELAMCPGFGERKAKQLHEAFRAPFRPSHNTKAPLATTE